MIEEVSAEFPIGKTQWAKWGSEARKAFNKCGRLGFRLTTAIEEANAVQAKVRAEALDELALLGQEAEMTTLVANPEETEEPEKTKTVQPVKKPRAPRKKKAE
jgi:hypothetical protein